jgi:AAA family ATP:ADP antiporter
VIRALKTEIASFSLSDRLFVFFAMLSGFFISMEYAVVRPVSNGLFLTFFSAADLPIAWLCVVPLNLAVVAIYNRYLPKWGCKKMFLLTSFVISSFSLVAAFFISRTPFLSFGFYVWKEVYIMLMFQQLWSVIHLTVPLKRAKYLYGLFLAMGAFGAFCGSLIPSFLAVQMGSQSLLLATVPIYIVLNFCYFQAIQRSTYSPSTLPSSEPASLFSGFKLVMSSKMLLSILGIVCFMQISSALIDFQFSAFLEKQIFDQDLRTAYVAQVMSYVHLVTMALQLGGAYLCIRYLGVRGSHLLIPLFLFGNAALFQCLPFFGLLSLSFICVKSFDFSLFTAIKEMLYIPLSADEKFRAKAVIDVFAHRASKAMASFFILFFKLFFGLQFLPWIGWLAIVVFSLWALIVSLAFKKNLLFVVEKKIL